LEGVSMIADVTDVMAMAKTYSSDFLIGILANVGRNNSTNKTNSETTNNSANIKLRKIMTLAHRASSLHNTADNEDQIGKHQSLPTTQLVAQIERTRSAKETSSLKDRHNVPLQAGVTGALGIEAKAVVERLHREDSADETGVPTKQHATKTGDCGQEVGSSILDDVRPYLRHAGALHCGIGVLSITSNRRNRECGCSSKVHKLRVRRSRYWRGVAWRSAECLHAPEGGGGKVRVQQRVGDEKLGSLN
jgi:hypothetical protein